MRTSNVLFSAVHLIVSLFVVSVGVFLMALSYAPNFQELIHRIMSENRLFFFYMGGGVSAMGVILLIGFYCMHRKSYYTLLMTPNKVFIEENILKEYVKEYWKNIFPGAVDDLEVVVSRDQKIEIITRCPSKREEGKELFERIENELGVLLARKLGYDKEFTLTITL